MRFKLIGSIRILFEKLKGMTGTIIGVAFSLLFAYMCFDEGDVTTGLCFVAIAVIFVVVKVLRTIEIDVLLIRKIKVIKSRRRFGKSDFVEMLLSDFESRNWVDYKELGGVSVYNDRIVTKHRTYIYADYGLTKIDLIDCNLLAEYLGSGLPKSYRYYVDSIKDGYSWDSPYFVYETPGGHLEVGGGGDYREDVVGYCVKIVQPKTPRKKYNPNW